jgi:hypothetical protein
MNRAIQERVDSRRRLAQRLGRQRDKARQLGDSATAERFQSRIDELERVNVSDTEILSDYYVVQSSTNHVSVRERGGHDLGPIRIPELSARSDS